jgi:hypothetical protein
MPMPLLIAAALAASLAVPSGETWLFRVKHGRPIEARRAQPGAVPARGEIRITARRMMGTTVTVLNNSRIAYTYRAVLIAADGKTITAKSCVLPANNRLAMESWPQVAVAVRVSDFKPTNAANCR